MDKLELLAEQYKNCCAENDALKAENARYREALKYISEASWVDYPELSEAIDGDYLGDHYSEIAYKALKRSD